VRAARQAPALQVSPVPQEVPSVLKVRSVQTGPAAHSKVAVAAQGFVDVQVAPTVQTTQVPEALQTPPPPQSVPAGWNDASAQTGSPVPHWTVPVAAQTFAGVQDAPAAQVLQACAALQKVSGPVPQVAPGGSHVWGAHTGVPVAHWIVAVEAQGSAAAQSAPCVQAVQVPALQTWFGPHAFPFATGVVSTQTGAPELQVVVPFMQELSGVQAAPSVQGRHWPTALQTRPVPQEVPAGFSPASTHTGDPEAQEVAPASAQGFAGAQAAPSEQASQTPAAEQTSPAPQEKPAGWKVRSVQTAAPEEHS
jgi:hypothetical protein